MHRPPPQSPLSRLHAPAAGTTKLRLVAFLAAALVLCMSVLASQPTVASALHHHARALRAVANARRAFGGSASTQKALPFSLRGPAAATDAVDTGSSAEPPRTLRMLMFGKPGAGKGTLSGRLVRKYDVVSLSTGDLLRQHIAERCVWCPCGSRESRC
jgi:hypothetical protein